MVPEMAPLDSGTLEILEQAFPKITSAAIRSANAVLTAPKVTDANREPQGRWRSAKVKRPENLLFNRAIKLVAGAGFEPTIPLCGIMSLTSFAARRSSYRNQR